VWADSSLIHHRSRLETCPPPWRSGVFDFGTSFTNFFIQDGTVQLVSLWKHAGQFL